jgi:hypothetical protein
LILAIFKLAFDDTLPTERVPRGLADLLDSHIGRILASVLLHAVAFLYPAGEAQEARLKGFTVLTQSALGTWIMADKRAMRFVRELDLELSAVGASAVANPFPPTDFPNLKKVRLKTFRGGTMIRDALMPLNLSELELHIACVEVRQLQWVHTALVPFQDFGASQILVLHEVDYARNLFGPVEFPPPFTIQHLRVPRIESVLIETTLLQYFPKLLSLHAGLFQTMTFRLPDKLQCLRLGFGVLNGHIAQYPLDTLPHLTELTLLFAQSTASPFLEEDLSALPETLARLAVECRCEASPAQAILCKLCGNRAWLPQLGYFSYTTPRPEDLSPLASLCVGRGIRHVLKSSLS